jgi:hypothetical protein
VSATGAHDGSVLKGLISLLLLIIVTVPLSSMSRGVGAVQTLVRPAIEIGIAKEGLERWKGFVGFGFGAPAATAGDEETGVLDDVVSSPYGSGGRDRVVSCCRENHGAFQLGEERFDRELGLPGGSHGFEAGFQFGSSSATVFCLEMVHDFEDGDVSKTKNWMLEYLDISNRDGGDDLAAKGVKDVSVVEFEIGLGDQVATVDLSDEQAAARSTCTG